MIATAVLIVIVLVQWPMFKGMFYAFPAAPPRPMESPGAPISPPHWPNRAERQAVLLDFPPVGARLSVMKRETWPDAKIRRP